MSIRRPVDESLVNELERMHFELQDAYRGGTDTVPGADPAFTLAVSEAARVLWRLLRAVAAYDRGEPGSASSEVMEASAALNDLRMSFGV